MYAMRILQYKQVVVFVSSLLHFFLLRAFENSHINSLVIACQRHHLDYPLLVGVLKKYSVGWLIILLSFWFWCNFEIWISRITLTDWNRFLECLRYRSFINIDKITSAFLWFFQPSLETITREKNLHSSNFYCQLHFYSCVLFFACIFWSSKK